VRRELKTLALCPTVALLLIACTSNRPAPVVERTAPSRQASAPVAAPSAARPSPRTSETRPESYTVKAGDTLYSIALEHGLDYRELAIWNGLDNPGALRIGMQLRLSGPGGAPAVPSGTAVAAPLKTPGAVEARPLGSGPSAAPAPRKVRIPTRRWPSSRSRRVRRLRSRNPRPLHVPTPRRCGPSRREQRRKPKRDQRAAASRRAVRKMWSGPGR
jgi:LysM repeat protein